MAVYVDPPIWEWRGKNWCHLTADTESELHAFAARLGLRREWFQRKARAPWQDHYDVTEGMRHKAINLGAVELSFDEAGVRQGRRRLLFGALVELCERHDIELDRRHLATELRVATAELARRAGMDRGELRDAFAVVAAMAAQRGWHGLGDDEQRILADHAQSLLDAAAAGAAA